MTDTSLALTARTAASVAPHPSVVAASPTPLGLWATIGWGTGAYVALWSPVLIDAVPRALWGMDIKVPALFDLLPVGHIAAGLIVVVALWWHRQPLRDYLALSRIGWSGIARGIGYGVLGFIGLTAAFVLIAVLQTLLGSGPSTAPTIVKLPFNMHTMMVLASLWFAMVVAAPVVEEMLFRGLMYRGLAESRVGVVGAMLLTSVVFGLAHYPGFGWSA